MNSVPRAPDAPSSTNIVFSNFVSARSLRRGLAQLGQSLFAAESPGFLVPTLPREPRAGDRLFFTDESSLGRFLGRDEFEFAPKHLSWPLDDKYEFAMHAARAGAQPVPCWSLAELDQVTSFPVLLKGKRSWLDGRPHPRGVRCDSPQDVAYKLEEYGAAGFPREGFFLQAWMPDGVTNCWSVSGWHDVHDADRNVELVTRKLAATQDGLGYALLVGTQSDPGELLVRARRLLTALGYTGPYELEFLQDRATGAFYELELNPRFWLQHSIFVEAAGNALLKRYVGVPDGAAAPDRPVLWVSGVGLITSTMRWPAAGSRELFRVIREWRRRGAKVLIDPPLPLATRLLLEHVWRSLSVRIGRKQRGS